MNKSVFRIGFSGHQQLGDEATMAFVSQSLRELLTTYREQARQRNQELLVYSALAPGADQLFIKTAQELDIAIEAVIPCAHYEEIFTSTEALSDYHQLLARCRQIQQLPAETRSDEANLDEIVRDIVERPESVLVVPVGQKQNVLLIEEYDLGAGAWQLTLPGGTVDDPTPEGIVKQAELELREEIGYRPGRIEKLLDFYSHPGYIAHKVHLCVAYDLEWDPLAMDVGEELRVQTFTLDEALAATKMDYRCDPEAALALWLYAGGKR